MIEIETTIKNGLPVLVRADRDNDNFSIHWLSGREITAKVYNSIDDHDMKEIERTINSRADTYLQDEADARGDWQYELRRDRD